MENEFEWMWSNTTPQNQAVPFRSFEEAHGERNALRQELKQNEARIAELKAQLEQNRMNADELDRRLAANRAGIGDTATSLAHQRNIDDRAYKAAMTAYANSTRETEKRSLAEGQKKKLIEEIEDIDLQLNSSWADPKAEPTLLAKRKRLVDELKVLGEKYTEYKKADESLADWEKFKEAHTDKRGNWDSKENKAIYDSQSQDTIEGVKNVKTSGKTKAQVAAEINAEKERKAAIRRHAAELQESMIGNIEARADFATRWNNPNPDKEIIELKEIFTWDPKQGFKEKK